MKRFNHPPPPVGPTYPSAKYRLSRRERWNRGYATSQIVVIGPDEHSKTVVLDRLQRLEDPEEKDQRYCQYGCRIANYVCRAMQEILRFSRINAMSISNERWQNLPELREQVRLVLQYNSSTELEKPPTGVMSAIAALCQCEAIRQGVEDCKSRDCWRRAD